MVFIKLLSSDFWGSNGFENRESRVHLYVCIWCGTWASPDDAKVERGLELEQGRVGKDQHQRLHLALVEGEEVEMHRHWDYGSSMCQPCAWSALDGAARGLHACSGAAKPLRF